MRRLRGQAVRHTSRVLHAVATVVLTSAVLLTVGVGAVAWRLSQGPVDMPWLTGRIEAAAAPTRLSIGTIALAWEGFREGVDRPLDLRLTNVKVTSQDGRALLDVPRAEVSLSIGNLFRGRLVPRAVELDGARLMLQRDAAGAVSLDLGSREGGNGGSVAPAGQPLPGLLAELAQPPGTDRSSGVAGVFSQLRRVRIRDAMLQVADRQLGAIWQAPQADIDLSRHAGGGIDGTATLSLALGDLTAGLVASVTLPPDARETHLRARLTPVAPAALARAAPALGPLSALDAPIGLDLTLDLDPALQPVQGQLTARVGTGHARVGTGSVPIQNAVLVVGGTPEQMTIKAARVVLQGHADGPLTTLQAGGTLRRGDAGISLNGSLAVDQVSFADLPQLWPAGTGGGARPWITENITGGIARDGHIELGLEANRDLSGLALTRLSGTMEGEDLTVSWLPPIPPLEHGSAMLHILDPDTLEITVDSARQRGRTPTGGLTLRDARMRITGMAGRDQVGTIEADIAGPVANAVALLKEPWLHLLDHQPIDLKDPSGDAAVALTVNLPLDDRVQVDDIAIHAAAHLTGVHLTGVVANRNLDQGVFDLDVTNDGLTAKGHALLAGIDADLGAAMDFRAGPPGGVVQRATVSGLAAAGQLAAAGLDAGGALGGMVGLRVALTERRNGDGDVGVDADLGQATLLAEPLGWRKPEGVPATASAHVLLTHDRLTGIDRFGLDGTGLVVRGSARCTDGRIAGVTLDRAVFGDNDVRGTVRLPADGPIEAALTGSMLDISAKLAEKTPRREKPTVPPPPGPAWGLNARFDRVRLAGDQVATDVMVRAQNDGTVFRSLSVSGATASGAAARGTTAGGTTTRGTTTRETGAGRSPFQASIVPTGGGRRLTVTTSNAGALLRGLDLVPTMEGGRMALNGTYDDSSPWHPLTGTAEIDDFRIHSVPWLAKLLQAMTLYGMVDVLRGPGVGFSRLVAPFRLDRDGLLIEDARAFSPSLGITAKGRLDLDGGQADVQGTIVPAYFFNSLLGNVPLVGKLFSPERGGGVFAAQYGVKGPVDDPTVSVNALSALTPGFLRGVFGLF